MKHGIRGLGFSEHSRATSVLHSRQHLRCSRYESVAVTAEGYGAQVILLLHRIALTVEADILYLSAAYEFLVAGRRFVEALIVVIRAEVHPFVLRLSGELILQFDMIEALVMHIISVNHHRQIPS